MGMSMSFPNVAVHFMSDWAHKYVGVDYSEDYFFDYRTRVEARKAIDIKMFELCGDVGLGSENPQPNPDIDCAGGILGKGVWGIPIEFHKDRGPDVFSINISIEQMNEFALDDGFPDRFPFQRMSKQIEAIREEYGKCNPTHDFFHHGVVNLGLDIRGNELFTDIYERPDDLKVFFQRLGDGILKIADYSEQLMGKMSLYKVGHCSMCMFPPEFYIDFVLETDARIARRVQPFGIHHHGRTDNGHLDAYKELETKSGVQIELFDLDWNADFAYFRKLFPDTFLFYLMDPVQIANGDSVSYIREIERRANDLGGCDKVMFLAGDLDDRVTPDQIKAFVRAVRDVAGK